MHYLAIYKPFGVLSQFNAENGNPGLGDVFKLPPQVYPIGRLDADSEGLLLLTDDKRLNDLLLNPRRAHTRCYLAQVEGIPGNEALAQLQKGVEITVNKKKHRTLPAKARLLTGPVTLPERVPPIRYRATIPDSWVELVLTEGKNRQVRKMTAKVGHPTLRLVRVSIENLALEGMKPGEMRSYTADEFYKLLKIKP